MHYELMKCLAQQLYLNLKTDIIVRQHTSAGKPQISLLTTESYQAAPVLIKSYLDKNECNEIELRIEIFVGGFDDPTQLAIDQQVYLLDQLSPVDVISTTCYELKKLIDQKS